MVADPVPGQDAAVPAPRRSPLHDRHVEAAAKFGDFAGWSMPLEYGGGGVVAEHMAVRERVGVFDVSHLGTASVTGPGAADFLNTQLSNDLRRISPGKAQYTLCCTEQGGVVDDLIVYLHADDRLVLVPNAANTKTVVDRLAASAPGDVSVLNTHGEHAILAVQGPRSADTLAAMGLPVEHPYFSFADTAWGDTQLTVCRTGYTGEHGYELILPATAAGDVWDAIVEAGGPWGIRACGLGARDTLRTEMGYPLHGQDISPDITPLQARLGWAVGWKKERFVGADALRAEREAGAARLLMGIRHTGRRIPRPGMLVYSGAVRVGVVTSGTFGPTAGVGIGLALIDRPYSPAGTLVELDLRGRRETFEVVKPPFVETDVS
jgi:aminomethyltransferase